MLTINTQDIVFCSNKLPFWNFCIYILTINFFKPKIKQPSMTTIHYKLKLLRQKHAFTQIQVAEKLNCSVPAYSKMETGSTDITDYRLRQLGELYQMKVSEIYEYGEPNENEHLRMIEKLKEDNSKNSSIILNLQRKVIELYEEKYRLPGV